MSLLLNLSLCDLKISAFVLRCIKNLGSKLLLELTKLLSVA